MKNGTTAHTLTFALLQADRDGVCRSVSPDLLAWSGYAAADLIGQFLFQLFTPTTKGTALREWERIISSPEPGSFEVSLSSKNGAELPVIVHIAPVRGITALTDHWIVAITPRRVTPTVDEGEVRLLRAELTEARRRADEQLGALKDEIGQIQRAKEILLSSIEAESTARIATLENEIATLRAAATTTTGTAEEIAKLRATIADFEARARATATEHETTLQRLNAELAAAQTRAPETETTPPQTVDTTTATLRAENLTLTASLRAREEEALVLRREIAQLKETPPPPPLPTAELENLRRELTDTRAARDALLAGAEKELHLKVAEVEQRFSTTAENSRREVEAVRAELTTERTARASERSALESGSNQLRDHLERATREIAELTARLAEAARSIESSDKERRATETTVTEQREKIADLERATAESAQFVQTATREFKDILRKHDALAVELTASREEIARHAEALRHANARGEEASLALKHAQRESLSLREERDTARAEASRFERQVSDITTQHQQTTNELFERSIAEVATRLNRILRLFYLLPDIQPDDPLCATIAAARTGAEDLVNSLESIHEYWLIETGGFALRRDNFGLRSWLSSATALYEFKAAQRNLALVVSTDPEVPEVVLTDGARLTDALTQAADFVLETTEPHAEVTISATVLSATTREVRVTFDLSAPCAACNQTAAQQLSLAVAERIVRLLGGEFTAVEAPGDLRRVTITVALLRGTGPATALPIRTRRRLSREEIEPVPIRPTVRSRAETLPVDRDDSAEPTPTETPSFESGASAAWEAPPSPPPPRGVVMPRGHTPAAPVTGHDSSRVFLSPAQAEPTSEPDQIPGIVPTATVPAPPDPEVEAPEGPLRVLLAEDNRLNQRMIGDILKTRGYAVTLAADGREAFTHMASSRFDLALIDCEMPMMDGFAATREIRAAEARLGRHTPIFAMTVYLDGDIEGRCHEVGTDELLTKPVRADALFALIDRYFPNRQP